MKRRRLLSLGLVLAMSTSILIGNFSTATAEGASSDFYNQLVAVRKEVGDRAILRAIHLFNENKRVEKAVSSLKNNDFDTFKQVI